MLKAWAFLIPKKGGEKGEKKSNRQKSKFLKLAHIWHTSIFRNTRKVAIIMNFIVI